MRSIVDGLRPEFDERITLEYIDADTPTGQQLMRQYELRSHPSTVVTDADGNLLWSYTGGLSDQQLRAKMAEYALPS